MCKSSTDTSTFNCKCDEPYRLDAKEICRLLRESTKETFVHSRYLEPLSLQHLAADKIEELSKEIITLRGVISRG